MKSSATIEKLSREELIIESTGDDSIVEAIHSEINESFRFIEDEILQQTIDSSFNTDTDSDLTQPKKDDKKLRYNLLYDARFTY